MTSRRQRIHDFYAPQSNYDLRELVLKSAAAHQRYKFRGDQIVGAVVVRCDINKYSTWSRDRSIGERVALLNDLFSSAMSRIDDAGGIYFRDEGDCILVLFSDYFEANATYRKVLDFCQYMVGRTYGRDSLHAKCTVAEGQVAIFQKDHERETEDWSAEGEPFVRAARLEQAVASKRLIAFYTTQFNESFNSSVSYVASPADDYTWSVSHESLQIEGLGLIGGWEKVTYMNYRGE